MTPPTNIGLPDGFLSAEGGVDSSITPLLLDPNQFSWLINSTVRGGFPSNRPGFRRIATGFTSAFADGYFQGAGAYIADNGTSYLVASVAGRIWTINLNDNYSLAEITISGDANNASRPHVWFCQAERFLIAQDMQSGPFLWDGLNSRRAATNEVPPGGPMAYGKGRLWVARDGLYFGGDLVWSDETYGRDSVIRFTENTFLAEGGAFAVPSGPITGLSFAANIDTSLGDGDLLVFTRDNVFAFSAPIDRDVWADLQYPIQRFAILGYGALNHESIQRVNGDLFFRSEGGVSSYIYARRDFATGWANAPIGDEVLRAWRYDSQSLLYAASAVNFDNRYLMTVSPRRDQAHGVWHAGLVAINFDLVSSLRGKLAPAWEGVWTGPRILQILKTRVSNIERCFMFALNDDDEIELWELTTSARFDFDGEDDVRIQWVMETRGMAAGVPNDLKRLTNGEFWISKLAGELDVTVKYRNERSELWNPWATYETCAAYRDCEDATPPDCKEVRYFREQGRARVGLPVPRPLNDQLNGGIKKDGYVFQFRFEMEGCAEMNRFRVAFEPVIDTTYGNLTGVGCVEAVSDTCPTGCKENEFCDPDDYEYRI